MKARVRKVKKEYGSELLIMLLVLVVVSGYAYWGSLLLGH